MAITVDVSALEKSFGMLKEMRDTAKVPVDGLGEYLQSPGMLFLKKHLWHYGGTVLDEELLIQLFKSVLRDPVLCPDDNVFLRSMKRGLQYMDVLEGQFNALDMTSTMQKAVTLANRYLPKEVEKEVIVYFLYGIRGTGIMLENEIAIDICDESISKDGILDTKNLMAILAHEFHHIGVDEHVSRMLQDIEDARIRLLVDFLRELLSEGVAYAYLPSPYDIGGTMSVQWTDNLSNVSTILDQISDYMEKICCGTLIDLTETHHLFGDGLEGYTAGYVMVDAIGRVLGETSVMKCIENCLLFPQSFNLAVRNGSLELPTMKILWRC